MRKHKYRVWCKDKNEWEVSAPLLGEHGDLFRFTQNTIMPYKPENHIVVFYTGIKDRNGIEIYEGDIIKTPYNMTYDFARYEIIFKDCEFYASCVALHSREDGFADISNGGYCEGSLKGFQEVEVIGNIYENPELLKE